LANSVGQLWLSHPELATSCRGEIGGAVRLVPAGGIRSNPTIRELRTDATTAMTAPLPNTGPADRPELPRVRVEARAGSARPASYEFTDDEFLIGGAANCHLRLGIPSAPPVVVQLARKPDGVRARRVAAAVPVQLNGDPLPVGTVTPLADGDELALAGLVLAVRVRPAPPRYVSPVFVPLDDEPPLAEPVPDEPSAPAADLSAERRELEQRARALEALEAQRRAEWDAKARELERAAAELRAERAALARASAAPDFGPERERLRAEQARAGAHAQELARQRELFAADRALFEAERAAFEAQRGADRERFAGLDERERALAPREAALKGEREQFDTARERFREELLSFERRTAALERGERDLTARAQEFEARLERLRADAAEWEETVRLAAGEQERLRAEGERQARQKAELDAQHAALSERAAQLEAQQAVVAVLRSKIERARQDMEREAWQLAAARAREDESQAELRKRIQEAEELRARLSAVQADAEEERQRLDERDSLLRTGLAEIRAQRDELTAEAERLRAREADLDARAAEFAEQAGTLKGRLTQALDLQARLEADRVAIREREAALAQSEEARQALQEQLRRRAEELNARAKAFDETARKLALDRTALVEARHAQEGALQVREGELTAARQEIDARALTLDRRAAEYAEKENALARQVARLKDVGAAVAAERKALARARAAWEADRAEFEAFRARVGADIDALRAQAPELDEQAKLALERLGAARDMLRGHLNELHEFARTGRADLEAARAQIQQEAERLRERHAELDRARDEHRASVAAFRQQIIEWQGTVADIRRQLASSETRIDAKQTAAAEAATAAADATRRLVEESDKLRREREELTARRTEVERHLSDMREWYRKKLRELARTNAKGDEPEPAVPRLHAPSAPDDLDPGDRQLGELLRTRELVDPEALTALWAEAVRQRRSLRQMLLASGAVTLYQLALIEGGNLDALVLGRFRVIDRLRVSPKETLYRVFDPKRAGEKASTFLLRHLAEAEAQDAVRPDEFRQRFGAARDAAHPNLAGVIEVLDIGGRPAAVQEWLSGLFSGDWPAHAAHPGCWVRLATMAAGAIDAAHRAGLVHGRLTSDSFLLTSDGALKVTGFGEPPWLAPGAPTADATPGTDLRAFGQVLFGWSQLAGKKRVSRTKAFPEALWNVIRRLEADAEPPMADTVAAAQPYGSAGELLADLQRIARETPFSDDAWEKLLKHVADNAPDAPADLRKAG